MQDSEVAKNTVLRVQRPIYVFLLHLPLKGHLFPSILSAVVSSTWPRLPYLIIIGITQNVLKVQ